MLSSFGMSDTLSQYLSLDADAVIQQFYPGELGGLALAEIIFGDANPSGTPNYFANSHASTNV